jgi:hypothetical protein
MYCTTHVGHGKMNRINHKKYLALLARPRNVYILFVLQYALKRHESVRLFVRSMYPTL